jgi:carboxylesterase
MAPLSFSPFTLPGQGRPVLLVHGLGGGPYELQRLGEHLHAATGRTVRAIQLPGHERPATFMPHSTGAQWVEGLERHLADLERDSGGSTVDVVAFSMGTLPTLRLAQRQRLRGKIALLAPFLNVYRPAGLDVEWSLGLLPHVPRRPPPLRDRAVRRQVLACVPFKWFSVRAAQSALLLARDVLAEAHLVTQPTLVLQGDRDTVVDASGADRLAARLGGPRQLQVIRGSDHLLTLDAQHPEVFDRVTDFLTA